MTPQTDKEQRESRGRQWHALGVEEVLDELEVESAEGLSPEEADARLREHGPNQLQRAESRPWWRILLAQFRSLVVGLLGGAAILAFATGRWPEGIAVMAVLLVNTAIAFVSEWKAVRSMASLRKLGEQSTQVRRSGTEQEARAADIVPGDIVVLTAGALVPADMRLVQAEHLTVNEAPLTGESVSVSKTVDPVPGDTELAERQNMLYKGTSIADGTAVGVAVATGTRTQLGRISELAETAETTVTPLQERLNELGRRLALLTIGLASLVAVLGFAVRQQESSLVVETALALGIAAIPEGLPIVATIALARGMYLMAKRNALVNRLTAVETLGATRVIFSDKTGTLTENRMRLHKVVAPGGQHTLENGPPPEEPEGGASIRRVVEVGVLCNAASLGEAQGEDNPRGDPTEVALLAGGRSLGIERAALLVERPEVRVEKFDPRLKKMATFHKLDGGYSVAVKGAPKAVLDVCTKIASERGDTLPIDDQARSEWLERANALAAEGLRTLAMATKQVESKDGEPYEDLCFLGCVGLLDPPREQVKEAIDTCQAAGIRVEMVTGDQAETARAIAAAVGIVGDEEDPDTVVMFGRDLQDPDELDDRQREKIYRANIFARVSPEQKLNLVRIYQDRGEVVAMTGDGVNDAPALKKADIGIAMGQRGTEAAKQVAEMVLKDDAFETIVVAVQQGRVIFSNIRKSVIFMLTTNVAEVMAVTVATLASWTLPLLPLQILYLNVLTDVLPSLALGVGPASGKEMSEPPRAPQEAVLTRHHWMEITGLAAVIAATVLGGNLLGQRWLGVTELEAVTISFLTLAFGKLWFTFNLRSPKSGILRNEVTRNRWVWTAIGLCAVLLVAAVYLPGLSDLLQTKVLGWRSWALLLGMSFVPLIVGQSVRGLQRTRAVPQRRRGGRPSAAASAR